MDDNASIMSGRSPRDAYTPQSSRRRGHLTGDKHLELIFEVVEVSFNYPGHFLLEFAVQSSFDDDLSGVRLKTRADATWTKDFRLKSGVTGNLAVNESTTIDPSTIHFYLPKDFCKNDKEHDVYLLVVAYDVDQNTAQSRRVGESRMPIYPREDTYVDHEVDFGEPIYDISNRWRILKTTDQTQSDFHCGTITYRAVFRETFPPDEPPPPPPARSPVRPAREPTPPRKKPRPAPTSKKEPPPRKTPKDQPPVQVSESPRPSHEPDTSEWRLLADEGKEEICIIIHGARHLPPGPQRVLPRAFVITRSKSDEDNQLPAQGITHAFVQPSGNPSWEELLSVEGDQENMEKEVVVIQLADSGTKKQLAEYRLPVKQLVPFQHYHLDMVWPGSNQGSEDGIHLYATIVRKLSYLPVAHRDHNFRALEVNLQNVRLPIRNSKGPLIATCTVISDYVSYQKFFADRKEFGVDFYPITFPSPMLAEVENSRHGTSQISLPGRPMTHPRWNHSFLFCHYQELATLFTHRAALIFEFFPYYDPSAVAWSKKQPVAHAVLVADEQAYRRLDENEAGIRVEVPMKGSLQGSGHLTPSAVVHLRLHKDKMLAELKSDTLPLATAPEYQPTYTEVSRPKYHPDKEFGEPKLLTDAQMSAMPYWSPYNQDHRRKWRTRRNRVLVKEGELPAETAIEKVVSEHSYIVPSEEPSKPATRQPAVIAQPLPNSVYVQTSRASNQVPGDAQFVVMEGQMAELDRYRAAIQKMGHDILALRERIRVVEGENSMLRRDLAAYNDTSKILLDSVELDGLSKPDLISRYVALKQKLTGTVAELATYKEKVQKLQNDLIKKNQREEDYLRMNRAHTSQQGLLQKLQEKVARVRKLEEACRQQEKVIERMEQHLGRRPAPAAPPRDRTRPPPKRKENVTTSPYPGPPPDMENPYEVNTTLIEENRRLRRELEDWKNQRGGGGDDGDKLELYQLLDKAEGRIVSLEQQLSENARRWGREKEELVNRLREYEYGLASSEPTKDVPFLFGSSSGIIPSSHVVLPVLAPVNALRSQVGSPSQGHDLYRGKRLR